MVIYQLWQYQLITCFFEKMLDVLTAENQQLRSTGDLQKDYWIYRTADSKSVAQKVEEYFLNLGMQGDTGGGTDDTCIVYCYRITSSTIE